MGRSRTPPGSSIQPNAGRVVGLSSYLWLRFVWVPTTIAGSRFEFLSDCPSDFVASRVRDMVVLLKGTRDGVGRGSA